MTTAAIPTPNLDVDCTCVRWCTDPYDLRCTAENFDFAGYLARFPKKLMEHPEGRKILTRLDPLMFALTYLRKHLKDGDGRITFADAHFLWVQQALRWAYTTNTTRGDRNAYLAPRATGKSTWWFLLIPLWAAAHGHVRFAAAFADSGGQAELHLATFKREMSDNMLLRADFPDLCEPARRHNGRTVSDTQTMLYTKSGFAFSAKGIDSTSLGMKIDEHRPDVLIFDDIEPPEGTYSLFQREKRLSTVQNAILPLNEKARVTWVGTVTMPGSLTHALVKHSLGEETEPWISDERFTVHHSLPIVTRDDGTERSFWPDKWSLEYLNSIRHTRSYSMNYLNIPVALDGAYWSPDDFKYGGPQTTYELLAVDPAVTTKKTSDYTGLAVIGYAPATRDTPSRAALAAAGVPDRSGPQCVVEEATEVRLIGEALRLHILKILNRRPQIKAIVVEVNQGGEHWGSILHDMPVKILMVTSTISKEARAGNLLNYYQLGRVWHRKELTRLEQQMCSFPKGVNDDMIDAVGSVVLRLLGKKSKAGRGETLTPR